MNEAAPFTTERYMRRRPLGLAPVRDGPPDDPAAKLPVVSAASFADKPIPPRRWIIPDMIPNRTVITICGGDGGDQQDDPHAAVGRLDGRRLPVAPDTTWRLTASSCVTAEDDREEIHRRVAADR